MFNLLFELKDGVLEILGILLKICEKFSKSSVVKKSMPEFITKYVALVSDNDCSLINCVK